jgi:hypothetical protein
MFYICPFKILFLGTLKEFFNGCGMSGRKTNFMNSLTEQMLSGCDDV